MKYKGVYKNLSLELSLLSCESIPRVFSKTEMSHFLMFHFFLAICWRSFPRQTSPLPLPLICQACLFPPNRWSVSTCWAGGCPPLSVGSRPLSVWIITQNLTSKFFLTSLIYMCICTVVSIISYNNDFKNTIFSVFWYVFYKTAGNYIFLRIFDLAVPENSLCLVLTTCIN